MKIKNIILIIIILIFLKEILLYSSDVIKSVRFSFEIWKNNVFPSLFPFFVLSGILIKLDFVEITGKILGPFMKIFKVSKESAFVLIMSILSGNPGNAKYTKELYDSNIITDKEASKLLTFTHFCNPIFILGTVGTTFLNNYNSGIKILISHYLGNLIVGLIFRNKYISQPLKKNQKRINNDENIGTIITNSLLNSINTLMLILGSISICLVLTTIISKNINFSPFLNNILCGLTEVTQGVKYISTENYTLKFKEILATAFLSFGGFSIHLQVLSIISETKIKYFPFFIARILHAIISVLILIKL